MTQGGRRRRHVTPALSWEAVMTLRDMRCAGIGYKTLTAWFGLSRETLSRAANGTRTYTFTTGATNEPTI